MVKLLFSLLILTTTFGYAQKQAYNFKEAESNARTIIYTSPDSALAIIKETLAQEKIPHDTIFGNTYNLYGMYHGMTGNSDSCIYYIKKSLTYLDKHPKNRIRSLMNLCTGYRHKGEYDTSLHHLKEALALSKELNDNVSTGKIYGEMASNYNYMLEYDKSIDYLLKGIEILIAEKDTSNLIALKQKLANTYLAMENYEFAADLYKETIIGFKQIGMEKNYYLTYVNLAEAYIRLERYNEAKKALLEGAVGLEKFGDKTLIGIAYSKLGMIEHREENNEKSIQAYQKAFDYLVESKSTWILRIGGEYINVLNIEKQYKKALEIIARAEPFRATVYSNIQDRMVYVEAIADTYSHTGNAQKAFIEYRNTIAIKDSIADIATEAAVKEIQAEFQTKLQREKNIALETKNEALEHEFENNRTIMLLYFFVSIVAIIMILAFLKELLAKNKATKRAIKKY